MPYYTVNEPDGLIAVWFGLSPEQPELDINREFAGWSDTPVNAQALIERLQQADRLDRAFGVVIWGVDDVVDKFGVSREEAAEYLRAIDSRLVTAQTEKGWDIIDFWREELKDGRSVEERKAWCEERGQEYDGEEEPAEPAAAG